MVAEAKEAVGLKNKYDFCFLFDVINGNPNGDPDSGNAPRIDPETGNGFVTDVCIKRKIRNLVQIAKQDATTGKVDAGYDIHVKIHGILSDNQKKAYEALSLVEGDAKLVENTERARAWMCQTYYDIRTFGSVLPNKTYNCGQVWGPVQISFATSIDRISSLDQRITCKALSKKSEAEDQIKKHGSITGTFGHKSIVPYGLYRAYGHISPYISIKTGFNEKDLALLWQSISMMFEHDHSSSRGDMSLRKLIVFKHDSMIGNAPAYSLFNRVVVNLKDASRPPRCYEDYNVEIDNKNLPSGITITEIV
jgi:CRISPR-associated protein Csd2